MRRTIKSLIPFSRHKCRAVLREHRARRTLHRLAGRGWFRLKRKAQDRLLLQPPCDASKIPQDPFQLRKRQACSIPRNIISKYHVHLSRRHKKRCLLLFPGRPIMPRWSQPRRRHSKSQHQHSHPCLRPEHLELSHSSPLSDLPPS